MFSLMRSQFGAAILLCIASAPLVAPTVAQQVHAQTLEPSTSAAEALTATPIEEIPFGLQQEGVFRGDYPQMLERGRIRVLVPYDKTNFFIVNGRARGLEHDLMKILENALNKEKGRDKAPISIVFKPVSSSRLISALEEGHGDVVAAGLTITPERAKRVSFTRPYLTDVDEVLVSRLDRPAVGSAASLSGRDIWVLRNSSYAEHLRAQAQKLATNNIKPFNVVEADAALETEDLLQMVNGGLLDYTVVDRHIASLWANVLPNLRVEGNLRVKSGRQIAWAVRKDNPLLLTRLNQHIDRFQSRALSQLRSRFRTYFESARWVRSKYAVVLSPRVLELARHFQKYAQRYDLDWLLMFAQGYQESRLDPNAISPVGALGVMQLLPSTAADMGFSNIKPPEQNIHAGIKYMDWIRENYFRDADLPPRERVFFALAAYNAGPNRVARLRRIAPDMGLDPNRWFGNVELVILAKVGLEPVQYVANIYKYYVAYSAPMFQIVFPQQEREQIAFIQRRLEEEGYPAGVADGIAGERTRNAIRAYQKDHGLAVDGRPSVSLLHHLKTD